MFRLVVREGKSEAGDENIDHRIHVRHSCWRTASSHMQFMLEDSVFSHACEGETQVQGERTCYIQQHWRAYYDPTCNTAVDTVDIYLHLV